MNGTKYSYQYKCLEFGDWREGLNGKQFVPASLRQKTNKHNI